ncbi:aminoglycoside phosphotransferase family protein [Paenibacillus sp. MWE-103]|uniref:Aminoglycoside phosphotransferase family protein n=1 Tax=Paenibacillus artemisiicola TaxID=1172618 RepID=A0ABS3W3V3_9BACL|nr:aminoglycoside phosphotransferase family protein [Paenibacillus artemisiicola]MBO7742871.1 aminoglycoside phosphotransferase family protein [Paenibacillus artemisiicola]
MKVRYPIADDALASRLERVYPIRIRELRFIPYGDSAYSYKLVCGDGTAYYLKLYDHGNDAQRSGIGRLPRYLPLTRRLHDEGLFPNAACPVPNLRGELASACDGYTVVLYGFIEGETLADAYPFPDGLLEDVADTMAGIHRLAAVAAAEGVAAEPYELDYEDRLAFCLSALERRDFAESPVRQALQALVAPESPRIRGLMRLVRELRRDAAADEREYVLCHGDLWGGNLIRGKSGLYVLDWENALLAPPEFDWFGYIGDRFGRFIAAYERRRGCPAAIDARLLRFYAYRHHLRNLTNWLLNILERNGDDAQSAHDLDLIAHHCLNRLDAIEPHAARVERDFG